MSVKYPFAADAGEIRRRQETGYTIFENACVRAFFGGFFRA